MNLISATTLLAGRAGNLGHLGNLAFLLAGLGCLTILSLAVGRFLRRFASGIAVRLVMCLLRLLGLLSIGCMCLLECMFFSITRALCFTAAVAQAAVSVR